MKLNLKMIAVAAAMVATGSAHADLVGTNTAAGNSSLALVAFNTLTNAYYVRDLGFTLNSFLPSSITTAAGDGIAGVPVTGDKSPEAGLTLNKTNTASFSDAAFGTWLAGQTASAVRWTVSAGDALSTSFQGVARLLLAATGPFSPAVTNGSVRTAVGSANGNTGLVQQNPVMGLSTTGTTVLASYTGNLLLQPNTLSSLDVAANLYYFVATTIGGASSTAATATQFGNSAGFATLTLASSGDLTYSLAAAAPPAAVPVPAAMWLMGSGLVGIGGMIRRRKAAAQA